MAKILHRVEFYEVDMRETWEVGDADLGRGLHCGLLHLAVAQKSAQGQRSQTDDASHAVCPTVFTNTRVKVGNARSHLGFPTHCCSSSPAQHHANSRCAKSEY